MDIQDNLDAQGLISRDRAALDDRIGRCAAVGQDAGFGRIGVAHAGDGERGAQTAAIVADAQGAVFGVMGGHGQGVFIVPRIVLDRDVRQDGDFRVRDGDKAVLHSTAAAGSPDQAALVCNILIKGEIRAHKA